MTTSSKVLAYVAALVVVLGVAIGIGRAVGPVETDDDHGTDHGSTHDDDRVSLDPADDAADDEGHGHGEGASDGHEHGDDASYELALDQDVVEGGQPLVTFRILDAAGAPVTSYDVQHEKELHLIAVSRDLAQFRHVHPELDPASGTWTIPIDLSGGPWRLYADFAPAGGEPTVAEAELLVSGDFAPEPLGPDQLTSNVDGYEVHLERDEESSTVTLHVTRDGEDVTDLEPYLGAYGHLVAIRAEDLDYLHVHPEDGPAGPEVAFHAEFVDAGRYRLFLDFQHGGEVHTADFTITVGESDDDGADSGTDGGMDEGMEHEDGGHDH
ncbi:hypothetical protein [Nocardioides stalactiti]|uniref:hypothetical protein n=1 Tax=Nocardioides stalactiti TaxID=2755356 RepID=UPI0015FF479E|nr:hypothetical protein [Nocardioides stalactiti]